MDNKDKDLITIERLRELNGEQTISRVHWEKIENGRVIARDDLPIPIPEITRAEVVDGILNGFYKNRYTAEPGQSIVLAWGEGQDIVRVNFINKTEEDESDWIELSPSDDVVIYSILSDRCYCRDYIEFKKEFVKHDFNSFITWMIIRAARYIDPLTSAAEIAGNIKGI